MPFKTGSNGAGRELMTQLSATQSYGVIPQDEFDGNVGRRVVIDFDEVRYQRKHVELDDFVISMRSFRRARTRLRAGCIRSSLCRSCNRRPDVTLDFFGYLFKSHRSTSNALQSNCEILIRDGQASAFDNFATSTSSVPPYRRAG